MRYTYLILLMLLCVACNGQQKKAEAGNEEEKLSFRMPDVPSVLTQPEERAEYALKHFWDHFDFADTAYVDTDVTEQAYADYVNILPVAPYPVAVASLKGLMKKTEVDEAMFDYFARLSEKYLYDPNSPFRNDELYIPVLEYLLESPLTKEKVRPASLLEVAKRNRPGEKAADFTFVYANGNRSTLYKLQADYLILFFYNPGCNNCKEIIDSIRSSLTIKYMMKEKNLKILAVYPDEDLAEWKNYLPSIPEEWINTHDVGTYILDQEIYDLKAIPTLYLLDKNKNVLLKDISFEQLENALMNTNN